MSFGYIDRILASLKMHQVRFVPVENNDGFYNIIYYNDNGLQISSNYPQKGYFKSHIIAKIGKEEFEKRESGRKR